MRCAAIAALVIACVTAAAVAQAPPLQDPLLERLAGAWVLRGTIGHTPTTHDVTAEWVLNHLYLRIHETSREKDAAGHPQYEAIILVGRDGTDGTYQCQWLDTTAGGGLTPQSVGSGKRDGDRIPFLWRDKDGTVSLSNTFAYDRRADGWSWSIDNIDHGRASPFARLTLTRK